MVARQSARANRAPRTLDYEERLDRDARWALDEGERFLKGEGGVHSALRALAERLRVEGIPYAVAGGIALFHHGYRRFTEDVDVLVTKDGLAKIHERLVGLGYTQEFPGAKNLRHADSRVKIEFLVTGRYPGDGKPKPVAFPDPESVREEEDGIAYLRLPALIELKLASGMTEPGRQKDLADVLALIQAKGLSRDFGDALQPFVRAKYAELWSSAQPTAKRYLQIWRNKGLTSDASTLDEMIAALHAAAAELDAMRADGVALDREGGAKDDYAYLVTTDPAIAKKYGFHPEDEFFDAEGPDTDGEP